MEGTGKIIIYIPPSLVLKDLINLIIVSLAYYVLYDFGEINIRKFSNRETMHLNNIILLYGLECLNHHSINPHDRIREGRHHHDLTFKSVAKETISKGYLDPTDGKLL